jgi:HSP20 family protein
MATTLTRWDPFAELAELRSRFDHLFEDLTPGSSRTWTPAIDVVRNGDKLTIHADVPGIKPEEVKLEVEDGVLTISGEHEETSKDEKEHFVRRERRYGAFSRSMTLPKGVDAKKITATTHDGIVEVTVPLPVEAQKDKVTITPTAG